MVATIAIIFTAGEFKRPLFLLKHIQEACFGQRLLIRYAMRYRSAGKVVAVGGGGELCGACLDVSVSLRVVLLPLQAQDCGGVCAFVAEI